MRTNHRTQAFILVSGPFTDGTLWDDVAVRLRGAGAEVHPATLTGLGGAAAHPPAAVDLETHIADVTGLIDSVAAPGVVLVGHDYGIHPVLGAAQQRVDRVDRVIYLDAGLPLDGDAPIALVPDLTVRTLLRERPDAPVPPPAPGEWQRWGNTTGLSDADLDRLSNLAGPQPGLTLTQPLRLTGALTGVPTSGILCTAAGVTIASVQNLVSVGMPQFQVLADPRVGFFELATGHWPMLSCPDELAACLLSAAAGNGHRITRTPTRPLHERAFLLDTPECPRVRIGRVDLHLPQTSDVPGTPTIDGPRPAVLFVHGGPLPRDMVPAPRDWPVYLGYARHAASQGVVGAVLEHRLHSPSDYPTAAEDVAEAVNLLRADSRVDPDRIAIWFFSGAGLLLADYLTTPAPWLRCLAATYPILAPLPGWTGVDPRFQPASALPDSAPPPIVLTRAGLESPEIAETVDVFLAVAKDTGAAVEVIDVPHGHHGFESRAMDGGLHYEEESRQAVLSAMQAVLTRLND
ncbi:alpha/beta hydrolase [Streptacidiphilus sp. P02-A3a]|uniref:alpha/beta hydrolase n=1 Tax=Streptacidiphilus sp. P02-A3a TaxID=2704468 RepID=UPI0015FAD4DF|nr:alpha/beta hydrolase [Streptacidiphilus sp. P02-A3a]QMU72936.1 alpha/beta hydrolase [Streptacidiphilus sp. P02-A3a]